MIGRISVTFILFLLAIYAFWGNALGGGRLFNPAGIVFLVLTVITWFAWRPICEAFRAAKDESNVPIIRMGSSMIEGMRRPPRAHRHSDEPS